MATAAMTAPKADQPRATTESLKRSEGSPSLTYRTTGVKNYGNRSMRQTERASKR
jgi:hypothetical protein